MINSRSVRRKVRTAAAAMLCLLLAGLFAFAFEPVWPAASDSVKRDGSLTVDCGNAADGYIMVTGPETKKKLKFRIVFGETTLTYDLNGDGETEVFPLQLGSGSYTCTLYQQSSGKKYATAGRVTVNVTLNREDAAYLCPNQYINYTSDSAAVQESLALCNDSMSDREKYDTIVEYISGNFIYDFVKALTVKAGTLPDIEDCFEKKLGICQDLSAVTVAMLRVQGIPARMAIGYVDGDCYHAWVYAVVDGEELFFDPTVACQGMGEQSTYVEERSY